MPIFLGQVEIKSRYLIFFKSQYLAKFFKQGPNFLHVITIFIGFKMTFCNIGSNKAPLLVSQGVALSAPPAQGFVAISDPRSERVKLGTARNYSIFPTVVHNENLPPEILDKSFLNMSDLVSFCQMGTYSIILYSLQDNSVRWSGYVKM